MRGGRGVGIYPSDVALDDGRAPDADPGPPPRGRCGTDAHLTTSAEAQDVEDRLKQEITADAQRRSRSSARRADAPPPDVARVGRPTRSGTSSIGCVSRPSVTCCAGRDRGHRPANDRRDAARPAPSPSTTPSPTRQGVAQVRAVTATPIPVQGRSDRRPSRHAMLGPVLCDPRPWFRSAPPSPWPAASSSPSTDRSSTSRRPGRARESPGTSCRNRPTSPLIFLGVGFVLWLVWARQPGGRAGHRGSCRRHRRQRGREAARRQAAPRWERRRDPGRGLQLPIGPHPRMPHDPGHDCPPPLADDATPPSSPPLSSSSSSWRSSSSASRGSRSRSTIRRTCSCVLAGSRR